MLQKKCEKMKKQAHTFDALPEQLDKPEAPKQAGHDEELCAGPEDVDAECIPFGEGSFQLWALFSTSVGGAIAFLDSLLVGLMLREMDHWCKKPPEFSSMDTDAWKLLAIPRYPNGSHSHCTVRSPPGGGSEARLVTCTAWEFDLEQYGNNVVSEWSLVCQRSYLRDVCFYARIAAAVLSVPLAGAAADRVGRKTVAIVTLTGLLLSLLVSTVVHEFQTYVLTQILIVATSRSFLIVFAILYEVTTVPRRLPYGILAPAISAVFGQGFEFFIDTYKVGWSASNVLIASLGVLHLATFYVLEESPAWLLATDNARSAERAALRAASRNGVSPSACSKFFSSDVLSRHRPTGEQISHSVLVEPLRTRTMLCGLFWFVLSWSHTHYCSSRGIVVDAYVRIGSMVCLVPVFFIVWTLAKHGRNVKEAVAISLLTFSGLSALLFALFNVETTILRTVLLAAMRVSINLPFAFLFFLTASLYPVRARCTAIGTCYAIGVLGEQVGQLGFSLVLLRREDFALGITAVLSALAGVAVIYLPSAKISGRTIVVGPSLEAARQQQPSGAPYTLNFQKLPDIPPNHLRWKPSGKRHGGNRRLHKEFHALASGPNG